MSALNQVWTQIVSFVKALEGIDAAAGDYIFALERRVEKLEREFERRETQLNSCAGGGIQQ